MAPGRGLDGWLEPGSFRTSSSLINPNSSFGSPERQTHRDHVGQQYLAEISSTLLPSRQHILSVSKCTCTREDRLLRYRTRDDVLYERGGSVPPGPTVRHRLDFPNHASPSQGQARRGQRRLTKKRRDVQTQLSSTRQLFTSYLRIRSLTTDRGHPPTPELKSALIDLEAALSSLDDDVADLSDAVSAAESAPDRFGLRDGEVGRRRRAVEEVRGEIEDMREELARPARPAQQRGGDDLPDPSAFEVDDGEYAELEHRQQERMMREQDVHLDGVAVTVGNLRRQAGDMGRELEEQSGMLDVVDDMADRVGGRLQSGMKKLNYVVKRNEDTLSSCCIAVLILALIILLVLLLVL